MKSRESLKANRLRELLHYEAETGVFTWKVRRPFLAAVGAQAGGINDKGYVRIKLDGQEHLAHRLAWLWVYGRWPMSFLDHKNNNRSDNRIANLREASFGVNSQNQQRPMCTNKLGVLGVCYLAKLDKYQAQIKAGGRSIYLGLHPTAQAAHAAYVTAKRRLHEGNQL